MKHIYLFSGLGADKRAFQALDLSGYSPTFIEWTLPDKNDTLETYAKKLLYQITTEKPILIGVSFGGIMAVEVAKQIETEKIILISSAKSKKEIPLYFRLAGLLRIHRLVPSTVLNKSNPVINWLFSTSSESENLLLASILKDTHPKFLIWAIGKLSSWTNTTKLHNLKHIHGTKDRMLPYSLVRADYIIKGGGHFMILNKAGEITKMIRALLREV
jgi:pimeloyl-ACP methyl ester carboxylesterase